MLIFYLMLLGKVSSMRAALHPHGNISFWQWQIVFSILIFSIIFGMRYGVGTDYFSYLDFFREGSGIIRTDIGFKIIRDFLSSIGMHYTVYFSILAFLQILFFMYAFRNERYLYAYLIFILFTGGYVITWMNVIRQSIAACIFIYSLEYIERKKIFLYAIWIFIASLFHLSAAFLIILYPFFMNGGNYFKNQIFQFVVFFTAVISYYIGINLEKLIGSILELFAPLLGYGGYLLTGSIFNRQTEGNTGLGFLLILIIDIIIIGYSGKMSSFYNSKRFNILYNLYFLGAIARVLFAGSFILLRPFLYFIYLKMVIAAYLFYYLYKNLKIPHNLLFFMLLLMLYLLNFIPYIVFGEQYKSAFSFFWQI